MTKTLKNNSNTEEIASYVVQAPDMAGVRRPSGRRIVGKRFGFTACECGLLAMDERGGCYGAYKDVDDFVSYYAENGETLFISIGVLDFSSCR